jgi:hypothetical protein
MPKVLIEESRIIFFFLQFIIDSLVFQQNRCTSCKQLLSLPSVHFLCMHSFHHSCLNDDEDEECPICGPKTHHILEIKRELDESRSDHDAFFKKLHNAKDGFGVVAEYYGRGMFAQPNHTNKSKKK